MSEMNNNLQFILRHYSQRAFALHTGIRKKCQLADIHKVLYPHPVRRCPYLTKPLPSEFDPFIIHMYTHRGAHPLKPMMHTAYFPPYFSKIYLCIMLNTYWTLLYTHFLNLM